jgi:hypothetical protein
MEFSKADQEAHDRMLEIWAKNLTTQGYSQMCLALPDAPRKTVQIGQHVPDLTAIDPQNLKVIGEVKTANDIDNDHTREQLRDYLKTGQKVMLLIPTSHLSQAKAFLQREELSSVWVWHFS